MTNNRTILITGVTGNQGGAVAQALQGSGLARPIVARGRLSCSAFAAGLQRFVPPNEEHNDWFLRLKAVPVIADARSDVAKATT